MRFMKKKRKITYGIKRHVLPKVESLGVAMPSYQDNERRQERMDFEQLMHPVPIGRE